MTEQPKALVFKIDRLNTHNGPGYRTVIYFKGCPLHCTWCHNPEGISPKKEIWWHAAKCIGCGRCVEICPNHALIHSENVIHVKRDQCSGCYNCAEICPSEAIEKLGIEYSVDELLALVKKDQLYFETSGGGVTVTGGEPGLQAPFIAEFFRQCQMLGIHTAIDTTGMMAISELEKVISSCDLLFLDIKLLNKEASLKHTGLSVEKLDQVIRLLKSNVTVRKLPRLEIRTPLIPGITDSTDNLEAIAQVIRLFPAPPITWELCLFNDLCEDKYIKMNKQWLFKGLKYTQDDYHHFLNFREKHPEILVRITGFIENKT